MIHVNSIAHSLFTTLASDSTLVDSGFTVQLSAPFPTDPGLTPWVGVYADDVTFDPWRLGGPQPWKAEILLMVVVQEQSLAGGLDANDRLHRALFPVLAAVNSNKNLDGTVRIINEIAIEPLERVLAEDDYFFSDLISIKGEVVV